VILKKSDSLKYSPKLVGLTGLAEGSVNKLKMIKR